MKREQYQALRALANLIFRKLRVLADKTEAGGMPPEALAKDLRLTAADVYEEMREAIGATAEARARRPSPAVEHTPGPWQWIVSADLRSVAIINADGGLIATLNRLPATDRLIAESEADARLIAAAPNLLAALITLLNATDDIADLQGCSERTLAADAIALTAAPITSTAAPSKKGGGK